MTHAHAQALTLAIHPASKGFGWALFEGHESPVNWGVATAKGDRNAVSMKRFQKLLEQYQPSVLLLEQFDGDGARRGDRLQELCASMKGSAQARDMAVYVYGRADIGKTVARNAEATRDEVAGAVAERLPFLKTRLPAARKVWESENERRSLFDAAALGLTHYTLAHSSR